VEKNASVWLKRLKLLDSLADVVRVCANKETREAAYRAIDLLRDASVPHEAWGREADLALLAGVYKHGFGNYESLRKDEQFSEAFRKVFSGPAPAVSLYFFHFVQRAKFRPSSVLYVSFMLNFALYFSH
jgi:hypothetical protein